MGTLENAEKEFMEMCRGMKKPVGADMKGSNDRRGNREDRSIVGGRKSTSGVEMNAADVAMALRVKVMAADMPEFMQVHAFRCSRRSYYSMDKFSSRQMAHDIKKEFDKVYGQTWHCIVGTGFGSFVTHSKGCFLYFSMEKILVMLFKTKTSAVRKS